MVTKRRDVASDLQRGFTLLEMLLVVFIVGVIAAISTLAVSNTLRKARLAQMAETVRGTLGRARAYASLNQCTVFVTVGPTGAGPADASGNYTNATLPKRVDIIVDRNRNQVPDDGLINTTSDYQILIGLNNPMRNTDIALSSQNTAFVETNWPVYLGAAGGPATMYDNNYAMIVVDPMGRTLNPNTGGMVNQAMTLTMTHCDMIPPGTLRPFQRYTLRISPLYGVTVDKH